MIADSNSLERSVSVIEFFRFIIPAALKVPRVEGAWTWNHHSPFFFIIVSRSTLILRSSIFAIMFFRMRESCRGSFFVCGLG